jgi:Arc/MetJ-type ribon-helix-helix transcriptional regulator
MKVVSAHVPVSHLEAIDKLVGKNGLYPSRSELVRNAIKKYLLKKLKMIKKISNDAPISESKEKMEDKGDYVKVPIENRDENEPEKQFEIYKILKKLEY